MNKLKEIRTKAGLTRQELEARSGVSRNTIRGYEEGKRDVKLASYDSLCRLAAALGVQIENFFEKF